MLNEVSRLTNQNYDDIKKKFKEKLKQDKKEFIDSFTFTSCDDCIHKIDKIYQIECGECRHYYGSLFERKTDER